jgi:hypothetical protein
MGSHRFRSLLVLLGLPALLLAGCGGFNGVVTPTLSSISPASVAAGSAGFTLTASGTNFTSGTKILWNGIAQATTVVSNTQLTAAISAAQIINPGSVSIGVVKSDTTSSNVMELTITGQAPQGPTLTSISPSSVASGSAAFTLTATGTGFVAGSLIALNGTGIPTTFDSATQLHATVPAAQIASPGTISVGVLDPTNKISNQLPLSVTGTGPSAPPPTLTSLSPATAVAGSNGFTLTATGTNFVTGSQIMWNGAALTSTFVSATQITAAVPTSAIAVSQDVNVSVMNPNSTISNVLMFVVSANPNVSPTITTITPSSVPVGYGGSAGFTMTLVGTNFEGAATVQITDTVQPTKTLTPSAATPTQLTVTIPASFLTDIGQFQITVHNPGSGRTSNPLPLYVGFDTTAQPASSIYFGEVHDVAYDSTRKLFYATVPFDSTKNPNKILVINAANTNPGLPALLLNAPSGADPDRLAISGDGQFLYVGLDATGAVARYKLPLTGTSVPDITISLTDSGGQKYYALDLQVAPATPHTIAVARGILGQIKPASGGSVVVYDDAVARASTLSGTLTGTIQWGPDATTLYAVDNESIGDLYALAVSASGVTQTNDYTNSFLPLPNIRVHFDTAGGLLYGDNGNVVNPATGVKSPAFGADGIMVPDSGLGLAYFLGQSSSQVGTASYILQSFNLTSGSSIKSILLYNVGGSPNHIIRWTSGTMEGLAFCTAKIVNPINGSTASAGGLYIVTGPFVTKTTP